MYELKVSWLNGKEDCYKLKHFDIEADTDLTTEIIIDFRYLEKIEITRLKTAQRKEQR